MTEHVPNGGKSDGQVLSATSTTSKSGALALRVGRFGPALNSRTLVATSTTPESGHLATRVPDWSGVDHP